MAAFFASTARVVIPKIFHRLAEMLDDVGAIEIDVFDQRATIFTIENDMLMFSRRAPSLNDHADGVRRPDRRMRHIRRDKKRFAFAHEMIDDPVAFANAHLNVTLELIKIFFRIDLVEIVSRVRSLDHHDKEIPSVVEVTVANRGLEFITVLLDPVFQINRRLNRGRGAFCG